MCGWRAPRASPESAAARSSSPRGGGRCRTVAIRSAPCNVAVGRPSPDSSDEKPLPEGGMSGDLTKVYKLELGIGPHLGWFDLTHATGISDAGLRFTRWPAIRIKSVRLPG